MLSISNAIFKKNDLEECILQRISPKTLYRKMNDSSVKNIY